MASLGHPPEAESYQTKGEEYTEKSRVAIIITYKLTFCIHIAFFKRFTLFPLTWLPRHLPDPNQTMQALD